MLDVVEQCHLCPLIVIDTFKCHEEMICSPQHTFSHIQEKENFLGQKLDMKIAKNDIKLQNISKQILIQKSYIKVWGIYFQSFTNIVIPFNLLKILIMIFGLKNFAQHLFMKLNANQENISASRKRSIDLFSDIFSTFFK